MVRFSTNWKSARVRSVFGFRHWDACFRASYECVAFRALLDTRHGGKMRLNEQDPGKQHSRLLAEAQYWEHLAAASLVR